jgi:hypothetical protein
MCPAAYAKGHFGESGNGVMVQQKPGVVSLLMQSKLQGVELQSRPRLVAGQGHATCVEIQAQVVPRAKYRAVLRYKDHVFNP